MERILSETRRHFRITVSIIFIATVAFGFLFAGEAQAAEYDDNGVPKTDATYTLTYPDGSTVTTEDYEEAMKLKDEEKLLGTYKTDEEGKILLERYRDKGEIRIYEKEIPKGYTAESQDTNVDLAEDEVTIINTRVMGAAEGTEQTTKHYGKVQTGDTGNLLPYLFAAVLSLIAIAAIFMLRKKKYGKGIGIFSIALMMVVSAGFAFQTSAAEDDDFVIYKVDEKRIPIADVEFEIYAKPTLTFEETKDDSPKLKLLIKKEYKDGMEVEYKEFLAKPQYIHLYKDNKEIASMEASATNTIEIELKEGKYSIVEDAPDLRTLTNGEIDALADPYSGGWSGNFIDLSLAKYDMEISYDSAGNRWLINGDYINSCAPIELTYNRSHLWAASINKVTGVGNNGEILTKLDRRSEIETGQFTGDPGDRLIRWEKSNDSEVVVTLNNIHKRQFTKQK